MRHKTSIYLMSLLFRLTTMHTKIRMTTIIINIIITTIFIILIIVTTIIGRMMTKYIHRQHSSETPHHTDPVPSWHSQA